VQPSACGVFRRNDGIKNLMIAEPKSLLFTSDHNYLHFISQVAVNNRARYSEPETKEYGSIPIYHTSPCEALELFCL